MGERSSRPGSRQVSSGSSVSTVFRPTRIASALALSRWACARAASPVTQTGRRASRNAAVRVHGELDLNEGPPLRDAQRVPEIEPTGFLGEIAAQDLDTVRLKPSQAAPGYPRVRVERAIDHGRNPGPGDGMRAWRRRAEMAAWLKRCEQHRAARPFACLRERLRFGMRPAARRGDGAGDYFARGRVRDDRADGWIGRGCAEISLREEERAAHEARHAPRRKRRAGSASWAALMGCACVSFMAPSAVCVDAEFYG